jgi:proline dehydrogenase
MAEVFQRVARPAILAAARSDRLRRTAERIPVTRKVVDRFVAGETVPTALDSVAQLRDSGRTVTIDYLGEDTTKIEDAQATVAAYLGLLDGLGGRDESAAAVRPLEVSLKLSALGQALPRDGEKIALENAHTICERARQVGAWVTVDAEDHTTTDSTLSILRQLRVDFPETGAVLQAYLHRTEGDCRDLAYGGSRVRLCKGAYREPASVAYQRRQDVDRSYVRCLRVLLAGDGYPMFATHDPTLVAIAEERARALGKSAFEFQMLYGIRPDEQRRLADAGHTVRVYVPYGAQWYGYLMRRLAERPANLTFFARALASKG